MGIAVIVAIACSTFVSAPASAVEIEIHCPRAWPTKPWKPGDSISMNTSSISTPRIEERKIGTHWDGHFDDFYEAKGPIERRVKFLDPRQKYRMSCGSSAGASLIIDLPGRPVRCEYIYPRDGRNDLNVDSRYFCVVDVEDPREADRVRIYVGEPIDGKTTIEGFRPHQDLATVRRVIADGGWRVVSEIPREPVGSGKIAAIEIARGPATIALRFAKATDLLREVDYMEPLIEDEFPLYDKALLRFGKPSSGDEGWIAPFHLPPDQRRVWINHKRDYKVPNPKEHLIFQDRDARE